MPKEGPSGRLVKNVTTDERGAEGGPFGPISKKRDNGRTGCQRRALRADYQKTRRRTDGVPKGGPFGLISKKHDYERMVVPKEGPSGGLVKNVTTDGRGAK